MPVLTDVSCRLGAGDVVAVLGSNGSGKSTLVKAALGLVEVSAGSVRLFDQPLARFHDWARVGYVPQRATVGIRRATVNDVVSSGRLGHRKPFFPRSRADRTAVTSALEMVRLAQRRSDELALLSGGQQQRALIARALAAEPDLLILDEPTAGVDLHQQQVLASVLNDLVGRGMSMLVVLHEAGALGPLIDRALVLERGHVVHDGAPPHRHDPHDHHDDDHDDHHDHPGAVVTGPS
jgi:zinc transport system ATP-binding protein